NSIDKGKATVFVIIGSYSGPIVGAPLTSWILRNWDWQVVFYSYGVFGMFLAALWYWHHRSFPYEHPRVNKAEHDYIMEDRTREQSEAAAKASLEHAPWGKFLMNYRFWAFGFAFFSLGYVMFLVLSWLPMYLLEARGLDMKAMGYATAYPWVAYYYHLYRFRMDQRLDDQERALKNSDQDHSRMPVPRALRLLSLFGIRRNNAFCKPVLVYIELWFSWSVLCRNPRNVPGYRKAVRRFGVFLDRNIYMYSRRIGTDHHPHDRAVDRLASGTELRGLCSDCWSNTFRLC
ncbi:MAG: MFS transporter, partial [Deltaproteobacteria bacterium]|nr:MFS transporter [Deltaproteobacteria bacterium]